MFDRDEHSKPSREVRNAIADVLVSSPMGQGRNEENDMSDVCPFPAAPEVSATLTELPSIATSAGLVDFSIGWWAGTKHDRKASKEVTDANGAARGVARVNKSLMANNPDLRAIGLFVSSVRAENIGRTLPWGNSGPRLLVTALLFEHQKFITEAQVKFTRMVEDFLSTYTWEVTKAQAALGNLFVQDDYPSVDKLRRKFHWAVDYIPLPEKGDFRIDTANLAQEEAEQALAKLETDFATYYQRSLHGAMDHIWKGLFKALSNMSDRLDYASKEDKKGFHESLVGNVLEMVDVLDHCNITNDMQMANARAKLEDALRGVTAAALKEDDYLRAETKRTVDEVIASLPSLDF